jgi:ribulose-phosphate 3-epimerase
MQSIQIAPSILSADFSRLGLEIAAVDQAGAEVIHIDVMDGHFVPNITIGPLVVEAARKSTQKVLDVHLMVANPDTLIDAFAHAGADWITVHVEACTHLHRTISSIKELGKKAGVVLNPATSLTTVDYILPEVDLVMLMSVNPGFGGQSFIPSVLGKAAELKKRIDALGLQVGIEIDGGISRKTIGAAAKAGVNIFVAGSAIYGSSDYGMVINELKELAIAGVARRD